MKIVKIGLRSTTVRTSAQAEIIVPNTDLITNQVTNWTLTDRYAQGKITVGVAYGSDVALVMQTLKECALAHPGVMKNPEPGILFCSFGDSSLDFELCVRVMDVDNRSQIESDLRQEIDRRFRQASIEIPFPQRDLHVRSVESMNEAAVTVERIPQNRSTPTRITQSGSVLNLAIRIYTGIPNSSRLTNKPITRS
jgi:small-conductance mechanosensitive channel